MPEEKKEEIVVVTFLTREQIDYLDKAGKDCHTKHGRKLSRARILRELIDLLMKLKLNLAEIDLKNEAVSEGILRLIINLVMELKIDLESINLEKETLWEGVLRLIEERRKTGK